MHRSLLSLWILSLFVVGNGHAFEEQVPRYALVIGNADYRHLPLANAKNDAIDMAHVLDKLEYRVTLELNLQKEEFVETVRRFYGRIESPEAITIFYYAGHAIQLDSTNYLVPVNAGITDVESLQHRAFVLDQLLFLIRESVAEQNIIILDACRDNPFADDLAEDAGGLTQLGGGLAPVEAPANTLVAYATEPGNVSSDGSGRNGIYTAALLNHIEQSIPAEELFKKVRREVIRVTGRRQIPWEHSSLTRKFYFGPPVNEEISDIVSF